jgi:anti-sigma factor RsiW
MSCAEVGDRLDDYVDGTLAEGEFQELELHLAGCDACRESERRLRSLLAQAAALPREQSPSRDLWPEIQKRLERGTVLGFSSKARAFRIRLALAAAAALVVASGLVLRGRVAAPRQASVETTGSPTNVSLSTEPAGVLDAEREYARASSVLLAALDAKKDCLSPQTLAVVQRDLQSIDAALVEIRKALEKDPGSEALNHLLASTHQRKVKVLQQVVKLSRI